MCWISPRHLYKLPSVCHSIFLNRNVHFPSLHEEQSLPIIKNPKNMFENGLLFAMLPNGHHNKHRHTSTANKSRASEKTRDPGNEAGDRGSGRKILKGTLAVSVS